MGLSVVNNVASLNAQTNLNRTSGSLSRSLERLSSGLKINRGGDGPAALVISEQQRAQIAGLKTAVDNTNKAVALVQTAEGALNEINNLLVKVRGLALDSANAGVNDSNALAANQAEIANALSTIDSISNSTQFGTKRLLNGAAQQDALAATSTGVNVTGTLTTTPSISSYTYSVTQAAQKADVTGAAGFAGAGSTVGTGLGGSFTVNGQAVTLTDTDTVATSVTKINNVLTTAGVNVRASNASGQLRLTATDFTTDIDIRDGSLDTTSIGLESRNADLIGSGGFTDAGTVAAAADADVFTINGQNVTLADADTVATVVTKINAALAATTITASVENGSIRLVSSDVATTITIADTDAGAAAAVGLTTGATAPTASVLHTDGSLSFINSQGSSVVVGGTGNQFTLSDELLGASVTLDADTTNSLNSVAPTNATFDVGQRLVFQIGANAGQTASLSISSAKTGSLGVGAAQGVTSLADIDVTTADGAQSAIAVIDQAISEITNKRGELGAFQANTLESTANNLRTTLENTTTAESVIRDTDFALEIANFTKSQVQLQAGSTVLGNANQIPSLISSLLRG